MIDWRKLAATVDAAVQQQFGERVRFVPVLSEGYDVGVPDGARSPFEVVAMFETANQIAMNLAGDHGGSPFGQRIALGDAAVHVPTSNLPAAGVQTSDRVELLDRGETYEIVRIVNDATGITIFHVVRV